VLNTVLLLALYTTLPTVSFGLLLPVAWRIDGRSLLSVEAGAAFGIPDLIPWPLNTVVGFSVALVAGTVLFKTIITAGEVSLLIHLGERSEADQAYAR
jgi:hypothetical protein